MYGNCYTQDGHANSQKMPFRPDCGLMARVMVSSCMCVALAQNIRYLKCIRVKNFTIKSILLTYCK